MMVFRKQYQMRKGIQYIHNFPSMIGENSSAVAEQSPGVNRLELLRDGNKQVLEFAALLPLLKPKFHQPFSPTSLLFDLNHAVQGIKAGNMW